MNSAHRGPQESDAPHARGDEDRSGNEPVADAKRALRRRVLASRREVPAEVRSARDAALGAHLAGLPELAAAGSVAAYVSVGTEPSTVEVLADLHARGVRVLLPVLLPDGDLDWAPWTGPESLREAGRGLFEPNTAPLGEDAVAGVDVVLVPGVAVSPTGVRMGRGGGSYDRALARCDEHTLTVLLLHPGETGQDVPSEPHDRAVDLVVTAEGIQRFTRP